MNRRKKPAVAVESPAVNPETKITEPQSYFRVKRASEYLDCTESTIRIAYRDGKLQGKIIGKRLLFTRAALDEFFGAA